MSVASDSLDEDLQVAQNGVENADWSFEGPGQRVGYDNLTAIDWIFEYTKERQRLRALLSNTTGLVGYIRQILDVSQIWGVLIATGVAAGIIAACIDIASNWLGDLKTGYCQNGPDGGKLYLNKGFCCWGLEGTPMILMSSHVLSLTKVDSIEWSQCRDWTPWSSALHVRVKAGGYSVEYLFYIVLSVRMSARVRLLTCS